MTRTFQFTSCWSFAFTTRLRRPVLISWLLLGTAAGALAQSPPTPTAPTDDAIRTLLAERVDVHRQAIGIVVGITDKSGHRFVTYGARAKGDARPLDGDTVFEIGSITKAFTSVLLADAVRRGEVALSDPIGTLLPPEVKTPERNGRRITLADLATHTSGLPSLPTNFQPKDSLNPYADYSVEQLYEYLASVQLTRDIGAQYEYSNLAVGLLGHLLSRRTGMDYETLVRTRITGPLGMTRTSIVLSDDMRARLATGHTASLDPTLNWDLPTLAGAGALRSTAQDMLVFLDAAMGTRQSPLAPAFAAMLAVRRPTGTAGMEIALGWHILGSADSQIIWHNGGTGGYRTWAGYNPKSRRGVVVLANVSTAAGPDDIGRHVLNPAFPLTQSFPPPPASVKPRTETSLDPAVFDRYVGRYQLAPAFILTVSREGTRFLVQLTGQPAFDVYAENETNFFLKLVDAQLTFETDAQGKSTAVVLHQNGADLRAPRLEGDPIVRKEIAIDPAIFERYVAAISSPRALR